MDCVVAGGDYICLLLNRPVRDIAICDGVADRRGGLAGFLERAQHLLRNSLGVRGLRAPEVDLWRVAAAVGPKATGHLEGDFPPRDPEGGVAAIGAVCQAESCPNDS